MGDEDAEQNLRIINWANAFYTPGTYAYRFVTIELEEKSPPTGRFKKVVYGILSVIQWALLIYSAATTIITTVLVVINENFLGLNPTYDDNYCGTVITALRYTNFAYALDSFPSNVLRLVTLYGHKDTLLNYFKFIMNKFFYLNWICSILLIAGDKNLYLIENPTWENLWALQTPIIAAAAVISGYHAVSGHVIQEPILSPATGWDAAKVVFVDLLTNWIVLLYIPVANLLAILGCLVSVTVLSFTFCFESCSESNAVARLSCSNITFLRWRLQWFGIGWNLSRN